MATKRSFSDVVREGNRHVYYNITIEQNAANNPYLVPTNAVFDENRTNAILQTPSEWEGAIVRFDAPTDSIPIRNVFPIPQDENSPAFLPAGATGNNNVNKLYESVTLSYFGTPTGAGGPTGATTQTYLEWTSENVQGPIINIFSAANTTKANSDEYYNLYFYQNMLDIMNTAIAGAYYGTNFTGGTTDTSPPKLASAPAPFFVFNAETQLISLIVHQSFNPNYGNNPTTGTIQLYMNNPLYSLFAPSLVSLLNSYSDPQGQVFQVIIKNDGDNYLPTMGTGATGTVEQFTVPDIQPPPAYNAAFYYQIGDICQSAGLLYISLTANNINNTPAASASNWKAYTIGFTGGYAQTNYLQIQQESNTLPAWNAFKTLLFTSSSLGTTPEVVANLNQGGASNYRPVLTDFIPAIVNGPDARTNLIYFPQGPYRMFNLNGNTPLLKMDMQVYWTDNYQNIFPLQIAYGKNCTTKLMFRRRDYTGS